MSQFRLKYDQMRDNDPSDENAREHIQCYEQPAYERKVSFIQLDGKRASIGYVFLTFSEYHPDMNKIILYFTKRTVMLTGVNLAKLFDDFDLQLPRKVYCVEERYNRLEEGEKPIVNKIEIMDAN